MAALRRPNLVLIMADQLKVGALPWYGNTAVHAPCLSHLAQNSAVFRSAFTPYPLCVPARAALFSGQYPRNLGSRGNSVLLPRGVTHLFEVLSEAGYRTGLSGKNHCFGSQDIGKLDFCFLVGHQSRVDSPAHEFLSSSMFSASCGAAACVMPVEDSTSSIVTDAAIGFLRDQNGGEPFFLWVSYPDPHPPYQAPQNLIDLYMAGRVDLPSSFREDLTLKPRRQQIARHMFGMGSVSEDQMRWTTAVYYSMITHLDHQIGRLIAELEEVGCKDDTVVVFTSDHGEYMGEHGLIRKSNALYDCLVRVPLIVSGPGIERFDTDALVELTDLAPTLVDLLQLRTLPAARELYDGADGMSFAEVLLGKAAKGERSFVLAEVGTEGLPPAWEDLVAVADGPLDERHPPWGARPEAWRGRGVMFRTQRWKYVHYLDGDCGELYDLATDPDEVQNLCGEDRYSQWVEELRRRLLDCLLLTERRTPVFQGSGTGGSSGGEAVSPAREEMILMHGKITDALQPLNQV